MDNISIPFRATPPPLVRMLADRAPTDVVIQSAEQALTAAELLDRVEQLQVVLRRKGIDRSGLIAGNSIDWVVADIACQAAEICLLPIPVFFADKQIVHSLQSVGVDAVLTDDPTRIINLLGADFFAPDSEEIFGLTILCPVAPALQPLPPSTQKITFTSGSTGAPRGVCLSVSHQMRVVDALHSALKIQAPRHLCLLPLSTLLENIGGVYYPLYFGGSIVVLPDDATGFSGSTSLDMLSMLQTIDRHQPTSIILHPQMLVGLVAALEDGWRPPAELEFAAVGGAKVSAELIAKARQLGLPVYEGYGLSETASVACLNLPGSNCIGSAGRPLAHVDLSIDDGEVVIGGNTFLGYVGDPKSWERKIVRTGDIGKLDPAGYLHLLGRKKNIMISSLGRNISPEWVESELLLHAEIGQCVVFGDARPYCTALIAAADQAITDSNLQRLIDTVNTQLPDYAQIRRWHRLARVLGPADGFYTENGRPRRAAIEKDFAPVIDALYVSRISPHA
jgi:long-chain acyl-CoA synthetase